MKKYFQGTVLVLILSLSFVLFLALARVVWTGRYTFAFLPWNLFLAGLPWLISQSLGRSGKLAGYQRWTLFFLWLLFFPNAPYLVTDLIHFDPEPGIPVWFDVILLFSAAWTGLWMGLMSLPPVERFLASSWGMFRMRIAMPLLLFLSAYGVYLGRVLRWNSWDMFTRPGAILYDTALRVRHPFHHLETWGLTAMMGVLLCMVYYGMKAGKIREWAN